MSVSIDSLMPPPILPIVAIRVESIVEQSLRRENVHWETEGHLQLATWGTTTIEQKSAKQSFLLPPASPRRQPSLCRKTSRPFRSSSLGGTRTRVWPFCRRFFETGDEFKEGRAVVSSRCRVLGRFLRGALSTANRKTLISRLARKATTAKKFRTPGVADVNQ